METKRISVPEDVHERLEEERREHESVGDTIDRLLGRPQLAAFWDAWDDETADAARDAIAASRERSTVRTDEQ